MSLSERHCCIGDVLTRAPHIIRLNEEDTLGVSTGIGRGSWPTWAAPTPRRSSPQEVFRRRFDGTAHCNGALRAAWHRERRIVHAGGARADHCGPGTPPRRCRAPCRLLDPGQARSRPSGPGSARALPPSQPKWGQPLTSARTRKEASTLLCRTTRGAAGVSSRVTRRPTGLDYPSQGRVASSWGGHGGTCPLQQPLGGPERTCPAPWWTS
jgi:hypothetical protein